jgi:hypothetical protein
MPVSIYPPGLRVYLSAACCGAGEIAQSDLARSSSMWMGGQAAATNLWRSCSEGAANASGRLRPGSSPSHCGPLAVASNALPAIRQKGALRPLWLRATTMPEFTHLPRWDALRRRAKRPLLCLPAVPPAASPGCAPAATLPQARPCVREAAPARAHARQATCATLTRGASLTRVT